MSNDIDPLSTLFISNKIINKLILKLIFFSHFCYSLCMNVSVGVFRNGITRFNFILTGSDVRSRPKGKHQKGMNSKLYPIRIIVTVNVACDMSLILYEILCRKATM